MTTRSGDGATRDHRGGPKSGGGPAEERAATGAGAPSCELCGAVMLDRHCKVVCLNCGYMRDCSDP